MAPRGGNDNGNDARQYNDGTRPAQARQGQCNDGVTTKVKRERGNGRARAAADGQCRQGKGGMTAVQRKKN